MSIGLSTEDEAFRDEVRAFFEANVPGAIRFKHDVVERQNKEAAAWFQKLLNERGWGVPGWPKSAGGPGWSAVQQSIFHAECARIGAPLPSQFGPLMIGPVLYTFGSQAQRERHLPGIRDGSVFWCQGYSEPGAGSDLANLKTRAVRDGDEYVVNGQKIWTTQAHWADWMFCLVRTDSDARPQNGISFLLIDMNTPGIAIRPIVSIDRLHHLNEVFFSDVRVPAENLVGEENKGWTYAKFLLGNERTGLAGVGHLRLLLSHLRLLAGLMAEDSPDFDLKGAMRKHAELVIRVDGLEALERRALQAPEGSAEANTLAMPLKLMGTTLQQDVSQFGIEIAGADACPLPGAVSPPAEGANEIDLNISGPVLMQHYLFKRAATIYGGTSEVQRTIMAKAILGT
jgi:alkylation response protein AidB-like acyl-CoA dehydrogenase